MSNSEKTAFELAKTLAEHKAEDVVVLDLRGLAGWTDFFVIACGTSTTHLRSLGRFAEECLESLAMAPLNRSSAEEDQTWILIDAGDVIAHIMTRETRKFYELEKLWFKAKSTAVLLSTAETKA